MPRPDTSRDFCCCMDARVGIFIFGTLLTLGGGVLGAGAWFELQKHWVDLKDSQKAILIITALVWSLLPIISIYGIISVVLRRHRLVRVYVVSLWGHAIPALLLPFFLIWSFDRDTLASVNALPCFRDAENIDDVRRCNYDLNLQRGVAGLVLFVLFCIEIYNAILANRYWTKLNFDALYADPSSYGVGLGQMQQPYAQGPPSPHAKAPLDYQSGGAAAYLPQLPYAPAAPAAQHDGAHVPLARGQDGDDSPRSSLDEEDKPYKDHGDHGGLPSYRDSVPVDVGYSNMDHKSEKSPVAA